MSLTQQLKTTIVKELMLEVDASEISDDAPLFGPGGIGLDSVDALQLVVALEKHFGLKIDDPEKAREIFASINTIAAAVEQKNSPGSSA